MPSVFGQTRGEKMSVYEVLGEIIGFIAILIAIGWVVTKIQTRNDQSKISTASLLYKGIGVMALIIGILVTIGAIAGLYGAFIDRELGILNLIMAIILPSIFFLSGWHFIKG